MDLLTLSLKATQTLTKLFFKTINPNKHANFDQTFLPNFYFLPNFLFGKTSFVELHLAKLNLAKLSLAWIGCANPFPGFARFYTGYANGYRLYWEMERERERV